MFAVCVSVPSSSARKLLGLRVCHFGLFCRSTEVWQRSASDRCQSTAARLIDGDVEDEDDFISQTRHYKPWSGPSGPLKSSAIKTKLPTTTSKTRRTVCVQPLSSILVLRYGRIPRQRHRHTRFIARIIARISTSVSWNAAYTTAAVVILNSEKLINAQWFPQLNWQR